MSNPTWMSGGSGSGVYDPVTTTDGFPQNGGDVRFSDHDEGWPAFKGKGRTYNFGTYRKSGMKAVCDEIRNRSRPKCLLITFIASVAVILIFLIVVIAKSHQTEVIQTTSGSDSDTRINKWIYNHHGLNFMPMGGDQSDLIAFSPIDNKSYTPFVEGLSTAVKAYDTALLHNYTHVLCNETYYPANKTCQQPLTVFGTKCTSSHKFGYSAGQPCILLTFDLRKDYTMRAVHPKDGDIYMVAADDLGDRLKPDTIGVSCMPIPEHRDKVHNLSLTTTEYNPPTGFPDYFFRQRTTGDFVPPAVMVQFNNIKGSVHDDRIVRFTCTAYGMMYDAQNELLSPTGMFTTTFAFKIQ